MENDRKPFVLRKVSPRNLKRSYDDDRAYSKFTLHCLDHKEDEPVSFGYMHYQGVNHLKKHILAFFQNRNLTERYEGKRFLIEIEQFENGTYCEIEMRI